VVREIDEISYDDYVDDGKIVAIKSTIPPGTTNDLNKECKNVSVIFNPEFLTEANFIDDFKNQNRIIIGGERPSTTKLRQVYSLVFPDATIVKTGSKTAEMVKYFTNTFLTTKVSFANEMYLICDKLGIDYDKVVEYSTYDERLGKSHWAVPGPDGHYGFGGSCFPKDINALIKVAEELDIHPNMLIGAWETNLDVRPEEDWKKLKGRAVVEENK
jgi:UDPglucose 6-dehydrogenase